MQVKVFKDHQELSESVATAILHQVMQKPDSVICIASGDTPKLAYEMAAEKGQNQQINFEKVRFLGLDEWVGVPVEIPGNCGQFLMKTILIPLGIPEKHIFLFDSMATNLDKECRKMDMAIDKLGGIDLMVVGIGMNGHIGFNEPGVSIHLKSHVALLQETTRSVGQKYFKQKFPIEKGLTLGLQHLQDSRNVILMANGRHKSEIIKKTLENEISEDIPATLLRKLDNGQILLDQDAASALSAI
jgi:glucosamine-6-phosphate isomerase